MATIRRRLTFWYTVALAVTVLAFGTALYIERRQASVRELDQRLTLEADLAQRLARPVVQGAGPDRDHVQSQSHAGPRNQRLPRGRARLSDRRRHRRPASGALRRCPGDSARRRWSSLTAPLDTLPLRRHPGVITVGPPVGSMQYLVDAGRQRGPRPSAGCWWPRPPGRPRSGRRICFARCC